MAEDTPLPRRTLERLRLLADGDVKARQHAVDTLIGDGHPVVVRALAEALSDEAPGVREGAAFALATCGPLDEEIAPLLAEALSASLGDWRQVCRLALALERCDGGAAAALRPLVACLEQAEKAAEDADARRAALLAHALLIPYAVDGKPSAAALLAGLEDPDPRNRAEAARRLRALRQAPEDRSVAAERLQRAAREAAKRADARLLSEAMDSLAALEEAGVRALEGFLLDEDYQLVEAALHHLRALGVGAVESLVKVRALAERGGPELRLLAQKTAERIESGSPRLEALLRVEQRAPRAVESDPLAMLRGIREQFETIAEESLREWESGAASWKRREEAILQALASPSAERRLEAIHAIVTPPDPDLAGWALPVLAERARRDPEAEVRAAALNAMGWYLTDDAQETAAATEALGDPDPTVRWVAATLLRGLPAAGREAMAALRRSEEEALREAAAFEVEGLEEDGG